MVVVTDAAPDVDLGIPSHDAPAPSTGTGIVLQDPAIPGGVDAAGIARTDVNRLAPAPIAEVAPVRLAAVAPLDRLVPEDPRLVHLQFGGRDEEPLALAPIG